MEQITNPHDAFFKYFLGKPEIAADFLKQHLPAKVQELVDLSTIEAQKESFIDEALRQHFSDLLYAVHTKQGELLYLYFLFEHKSYPDSKVAFQLLRYIVRIWEADQAQDKSILPVIGLVVYHGETTWNIERNFSSILDWDKQDQETIHTLQSYVPEFSYHLIDLSAINDDQIKGEVWQRVFALILKHIYDPALGERLYDILKLVIDLADMSTGMDMLIAVLRYIARAGKGASKDEIRQTVMKLFPLEGGALMKTAAQEWLEEGKAIGIQEGEAIGIQKGIQAGKLQAQRRLILQVLRHRFMLSEEVKGNLVKQLELLSDDSSLEKLTNFSLEAFNLNDFLRQLTELLPPQQ